MLTFLHLNVICTDFTHSSHLISCILCSPSIAKDILYLLKCFQQITKVDCFIRIYQYFLIVVLQQDPKEYFEFSAEYTFCSFNPIFIDFQALKSLHCAGIMFGAFYYCTSHTHTHTHINSCTNSHRHTSIQSVVPSFLVYKISKYN